MTSPAPPVGPAAPETARATLGRAGAWWPVLLALTAALFVAHALLAAQDPYLQLLRGDEGYYDDWAREIAAGALRRPVPFFASPLLAYWLGALHALGLGSTRAVFLANAALAVGAVAFTFSAARRLAGPWAALLAAALLALGRTVPVHLATPDKTALVLCLTAAALAAAAWALEAPPGGRRWPRWLGAGAVAGVAGLAHPLALVLVPAAALAAARAGGLRGGARAAAPYLAGALLAVSPATLHNLLADGSLVLVSSSTGETLYNGNGAGNRTGLYQAPPFSGPTMAAEEAGYHLEAERRHGRAMTAGETTAYWTGQALREMAADPGLAAARFLRRLRWSLGDAELRDVRSYRFYAARAATTRWPRWDFGLPALLGLLGALCLWRDRRLALPLAFLALYAGALSFFLVFGRLRLPLLVPLAILAGALLARAPALLRERRPAALAGLAAAALALGLLVFGARSPEAGEEVFAEHWAHAQVLHAMGREAEALEALERAVLDEPGRQPALADAALLAAGARLARGDAAGARRLLEAAARARPGDPRLEAALAGPAPAGR